MTIAEIWDLISKGGAIGVLVWLVWGLSKPDPLWVPREQHKRVLDELEEWKGMALEIKGLGKHAINTTDQAVSDARDLRRRLDLLEKEAGLYDR